MTDKEAPHQRGQQPQQQQRQQQQPQPAGPVNACERPPAEAATSARLAPTDSVNLTVAPFTGGPFSLSLSRRDSVEDLKKAVAKRLKVLKDRICLLYRERQLSEGTLEDNMVVDGSRITLLPRAETGLLAQKPEQSVMQALESLNESQVVDFLSGKAPLNLTMRLGDHMMLIQLQLSTVNGAASAAKRPRMSSATASSSSGCTSVPSSSSSSASYRPKLDTRALAEASKNLTQTLKQLSSEVLTTKAAAAAASSGGAKDQDSRSRKRPRPSSSATATATSTGSSSAASATSRSSTSSSASTSSSSGGGAIIESMHHHGKGVYSGTFSGTLNPALQDRNGQPKRDITTIIHILNDLLCAQYKNYQYPSSSASSRRAASNAAAAAAAAAGAAASAATVTSTCSASDAQKIPPPPVDQLEVTKEKMERLRRIMEERKERRRARREARHAAAAAAARSSYSTSWSVKSTSAAAEGSATGGEESVTATGTAAAASTSSGSAAAAAAAAATASATDAGSFEPEPVTA